MSRRLDTAGDSFRRLSGPTREALEFDRVRLVTGFPLWLRLFLVSGVAAITLGRRIYVAQSFLERESGSIERLLLHELAHVRQWRRYGVAGFLIRYIRDYVTLRWSGLSSYEAYRSIPFEREARAAERSHSRIEGSSMVDL